MNHIKYLKAWSIFFSTSFFIGSLAGGLGSGVVGIVVMEVTGESPYVLNKLVSDSVNLYEVIGTLVALPVSFLFYRWTISRFILTQIEEKTD
jgi:hypothetical protein